MTNRKDLITTIIKLASQLSLREMQALKVIFEHMIVQCKHEELINFKREADKI